MEIFEMLRYSSPLLPFFLYFITSVFKQAKKRNYTPLFTAIMGGLLGAVTEKSILTFDLGVLIDSVVNGLFIGSGLHLFYDVIKKKIKQAKSKAKN